jgi:membrane associated rhomboid family serine protease
VVTAAQLRRSRSIAPVTFTLIAISVLVFIAGEMDPALGRRMLLEGAHLPALVSAGEWWRALTAIFLHGGFTHVLFNMWALFVFGPSLEHRFGTVSFGALYLACGLGGSALYQAVGRDVFAVGASGAIFGLMGALLATAYKQRFTPAGRAVFSQVLLLLAINLAIPFIVPNVAWEAHVGGLITGVVVATAWERLPVSGPGRRAVAVAIAVAIVAMAIVLVAYTGYRVPGAGCQMPDAGAITALAGSG